MTNKLVIRKQKACSKAGFFELLLDWDRPAINWLIGKLNLKVGVVQDHQNDHLLL